MDNDARAVREYKKLLKLDSNYSDAYVQLGKIYYDKYKNSARAKKYFQTAYEKELYLSGYTPYNSDIHYYLGMIAVKEGRKMDAILAYMDLKNAYDGSGDISARKVELYKAIQKMDE